MTAASEATITIAYTRNKAVRSAVYQAKLIPSGVEESAITEFINCYSSQSTCTIGGLLPNTPYSPCVRVCARAYYDDRCSAWSSVTKAYTKPKGKQRQGIQLDVMLEVYYHRFINIIAISMKCCEITGFRDISKMRECA